MKSHLSNGNRIAATLTAGALLAGCVGTFSQTPQGASLVLSPRVTNGQWATQATVSAYTLSSIDHLTVRLFQGTTEIVSKTLLQSQLANPVTFSHLKANTAYRIKAYAYLSDNTLISHDNASSWLDITTGIDDRPALLPLPVRLIDIAFNASATGAIQIIEGGYDTIGALQMQFDMNGIITTIAGNGTASYSGDGGAATSATLNSPYNLAIDSAGDLYIADHTNNRIRKIEKATGIISTVVGNGTAMFSGDGAPASASSLNNPRAIVLDAQGNFFIADKTNSRIRKVEHATGIITTVAGDGTAAFSGDGGPATAASLNSPLGLALDAYENLYITDYGNNRIRKVDKTTGTITTVVGNGTSAFSGDEGPATEASLKGVRGIAFDPDWNLHLADVDNHRIRKVDKTTGIISTVVGNGTGVFSGDGGPASAATLRFPDSLIFDSSGNLYICDSANYRIRKVDKTTGLISTIVGDGTPVFSGDGGRAASASIVPSAMIFDAEDNLYVCDRGHNRVRVVGGPLKL